MSNTKNTFCFLGIILLVALNNNCFEYLSNHDIKASQTLFYRGIFTLFFCSVIAVKKKEKFIPSKIKNQSIRFLTTGGSLLLVLMSYSFLSAGTVSLLQRLDIPFLIFVSVFTRKKKKSYQIIISLFTIFIILGLTVNPELIDENVSGFLLVFGSVFMTAIGYLTVHKGSASESVPALINVSAISSILFGFLLTIYNTQNFTLPLLDYSVIAFSALLNIVLFYLTVRLYKIYEPERALLPFVWAIVSTSLLEMIIEKKIYNSQDIILTIGLTSLITLICLGGKKLTQNNMQLSS